MQARGWVRRDDDDAALYPRRSLSRCHLEAKCLKLLQGAPLYDDLTAVDIEHRPGGAPGSWAVVRLWRGHVVELPQGAGWVAGGREAIEALAARYDLAPG